MATGVEYSLKGYVSSTAASRAPSVTGGNRACPFLEHPEIVHPA